MIERPPARSASTPRAQILSCYRCLRVRITQGRRAIVEESAMHEKMTAVADGVVAGGVPREEASWRGIDRELRRVARAQAALDAEELRLLALAQEVGLHRELGMSSMLEYVERVLGHGPKAGHERLRVARELKELPLTRAALEQGTVSFSAVRELSRKVTRDTEAEWLEAVRGMCLREIEDVLSGRKKGDHPGDPIDPNLQLKKITLELTPPTLALFREACRRLEDELGHHLTDDETIVAMCATVLGGPAPGLVEPDHCARGTAAAESPRGHEWSGPDDVPASSRGDVTSGLADVPATSHGDATSALADLPASSRGDVTSALADSPESPRGESGGPAAGSRAPRSGTTAPRLAPYQIALTVCPSCDRGWHDAGGRAIAVPDSTIAQAICDAQYIGRTDVLTPERAEQEVSPATARLVHRRDRGRCQVPGCRSARWLHIHHIIWREHGGSNDPRNLLCLCFAHHQAVHQQKITITGSAPDGLVFDLSAFSASAPALIADSASVRAAVTS
ncbi:MAG TPA: HNH endonuclease signature motif containing protein [Kofleriaceae bacterium]|nr:HNH endonuclease signature motif containing protein [Kofleriaceae bacterium]